MSGNNQSADLNAALQAPLVVRVADAGGSAVQGSTVDWSILSGGGTLGASASTTNAQGQAQTTYTVGGTAGNNQVRAAVRGSSNLSTTFAITAVQPIDNTPASMVKVAGDNQSATVGQTLASPLVVRVRNAALQPLQGIGVQWSVVQGGGALGSVSTTTNAQGETSTSYTLGSTAGANEILAAVQAASAISATFAATASPPANAASVAVANFQFTPPTATISAGGTVTWSFNQGTHNVTWVSGGFANSGDRGSGTYQVSFPAAGTYSYYCSIHGSPGAGMSGTITVQ